MQDLICICKQKTFSPVSSTNSSQTEKVLPVKTSKPTFRTFVYFRNSLFDIICEISLFVTAANQETIARNLCEFGVAHSEEMEVNQWITLDIPTSSSHYQSALPKEKDTLK